MKLIDKDALVAEIERIMDEQQEICKADVALGKIPDSKNIEVIYQFQQFTKFLDTLEVKEVDLDVMQRMEECPYRQVGCTMYKDKILECRGACSWVVDYLKLKELKAHKRE